MDATDAKQRVLYRFLGHVQGRGFRYACVVCAERAHVTGWVRNERDGTVRAEVQGGAQEQLDFVKHVTTLVPGFGNGWTIASETKIDVVPDEQSFVVTRV